MKSETKENWDWDYNDREARELFLLTSPDERLEMLEATLESFAQYLPKQDILTEEEKLIWYSKAK